MFSSLSNYYSHELVLFNESVEKIQKESLELACKLAVWIRIIQWISQSHWVHSWLPLWTDIFQYQKWFVLFIWQCDI